MKTAIIHEWFLDYVGSEKVLEQIVRLYPDADLYGLIDFIPEGERGFILDKKVRTSFIQSLPFAREKYRSYLPLMPYAVRQFDLSGYDLIISNSHAVAKGIRKMSGQLHISYCHTPMRYIWDLQNQYLKETGLDKGLKGALIKAVLSRIRKWDVSTAKTVDHFIANSHYIRDRIKRAYERDATVIYPPVDIGHFSLSGKKEDFFLTVSRLVPYKKVGLMVEAFSEMRLPLIVIGDGPDSERVKRRANNNIQFMGYQKDDVVKTFMQKARAFVFAADEDFGIAPVEAQACGTPVIAFGKGGVTETVIPFNEKSEIRSQKSEEKPTGIFFYEQTVAALIDSVEKFKAVEDKFNPHAIRKNAERFGIDRFKKEFKEFVDEKIKDFF
ncbi:MAG: glycosyltransferase family 4 protein [Nitrospirae bacterium]|nr:glycosyltransferase family 4 protein [Nitrospirota bacterium]